MHFIMNIKYIKNIFVHKIVKNSEGKIYNDDNKNTSIACRKGVFNF